MVKRMNLIIFSLLIILSVNFISAVSIDDVEIGQDVRIYQTCNNCTYCNITQVKNPNGTILLSNEEFIEDPSTYYSKILDGANTTTIGTYTYCYDCGNPQQSQTGCIDFEVTPDGFSTDLSKAWVNIFILLFFIGLIATTYFLVKKIDFKKWNDSILEKYLTRNFVKVVLSALLYNIMKNIYIIYYLLGLPIMLIIMDLAYIYNIESIITLISVFFYIYLIGIIIVGIVFLSYVQEWMMMMMDMVKNMDWGVEQ